MLVLPFISWYGFLQKHVLWFQTILFGLEVEEHIADVNILINFDKKVFISWH